jgi:excisionase family DNA binding protein
MEARDPSESQVVERRLLSPEQVAEYLGLGSRFAVYRLVASGHLPALRIANKLRIDPWTLTS